MKKEGLQGMSTAYSELLSCLPLLHINSPLDNYLGRKAEVLVNQFVCGGEFYDSC